MFGDTDNNVTKFCFIFFDSTLCFDGIHNPFYNYKDIRIITENISKP